MAKSDAIAWILSTQVPEGMPPVADWPEAARDRLEVAVEHAMTHHAEQFRAARRAPGEKEIAQLLTEGGFAHRPFRGCNLWHDVMVAVGLGGFVPGADALFRSRFDDQISAWARTMMRQSARARTDYRNVCDEFLNTLVTPVERQDEHGHVERGPAPIGTYLGHAPLVGWLKVVFMRRSEREADKVAVGEDQDVPPVDRSIVEPNQNRDCRELYRSILEPLLSNLEPVDRTMIEMAVVDDVPQNRIARFLGVHAGTITRRIHAIQRRLEDGLRVFALRASASIREAMRECGLLLAKGLRPGK